MNASINESINDEAVYRTAPATPGLLMTTWKVGSEVEVEALTSNQSI